MEMEREVRLAQQGDREAFARLIHQWESSFYRVAKAILQKDEDCADAIQETILRAYLSIGKVREPQYIKTWMIRILIRECQQLLRKRNRVVDIVPTLERGKSGEPNWEALMLQEAIERLEPPYRMVILLYYFEELTVKEIAEVLEIPEGTVKSRLYRARQELHASLFAQKGESYGE